MCSSWICASFRGTAAGFFSIDQPLGASDLSDRSTTTLFSESAVSASEYGSVTLLVTTFWTVGAQTFTLYRYVSPFQLLLPLTDQTPLASSRRIATVLPSSSRETCWAV